MADTGGGLQTVTIADLGAALISGKVGLGDVTDTFFDNSTPARRRSTGSILGGLDTGSMVFRADRRSSTNRGSILGGLDTGSMVFRSDRKSSNRASDLRRGSNGTVAEWAASTMGLESAPPGSTSRSGGDSTKRSVPTNRRDRKRSQTSKSVTLSEILDEAAEKTVHRTVELPVCVDFCADHVHCQRICFPAERATRLRKGRMETTGGGGDGGRQSGTGEDGASLPSYGFPSFEQAGYILLSVEDNRIDPLVGFALGLQVAMHKKSSLQRFCLPHYKGHVPPGTGAAELRTLMRSLKRCDHVNVIGFVDCFEDDENLFLLYEYFPCVTLMTMMGQHTWTQEQLVNMIRELCAGVANASQSGLAHLGVTLCHVLVPLSAMNGGDPMVAKIFGFGLMGVLHMDSFDHLCWSPEALERFNQAGKEGNFVQKMEHAVRQFCDSWSIGVIAYALIARQVPFSAEPHILLKKWQFTLAIDMVDIEAKSLIEGFLNPQADKRLKADRALHHEWIRRRWRPPVGAAEVVAKLEEFCNSPLPKRLFGRFLAGFLEPSHGLKVARYFYSLDLQGTGNITLKELEKTTKAAMRAANTSEVIFQWLVPQGASVITLSRFLECFAEEVIDGRALRHAFESLDDDGSEEVNAEELFGALLVLDEHHQLTLEEVMQYISESEGNLQGADQDHNLDYSEFCELFPVRVKRVKAMEDRLAKDRKISIKCSTEFHKHRQDVKRWIKDVEATTNEIMELSVKTLERSDAANDAARSLRKEFARIDDLLKAPPGPTDKADFEELMLQKRKEQVKEKKREADAVNRESRRMRKDESAKSESVFGFESFVQDQALSESFPTLLSEELKMLKSALAMGSKLSNAVDTIKAHDAAEMVLSKVTETIRKSKAQLQEYEAFVEAMNEPEATLSSAGTATAAESAPNSGGHTGGGVQLSGRGLRARSGEDEDDPHTRAQATKDASGNPMMRFITEVTGRFTCA